MGPDPQPSLLLLLPISGVRVTNADIKQRNPRDPQELLFTAQFFKSILCKTVAVVGVSPMSIQL